MPRGITERLTRVCRFTSAMDFENGAGQLGDGRRQPQSAHEGPGTAVTAPKLALTRYPLVAGALLLP
jgi:hypothetical protein